MATGKSRSKHHLTHATHTHTGAPPGNAHCWVPNTDVYICGDQLLIRVELAGIQKEDLEVTAEGQRLKISGVRQDEGRVSHCSFLVMEINYGPFETSIEVPAGFDLSKAKASYQNGFLQVEIPGVSES